MVIANHTCRYFLFNYKRDSCQPTGLSVLHAFFDSQFTSVIAAFGAYVVVHNGCAAVAAGRELSGLNFVVSSSFCCSGLRKPVFWMWHNLLFFAIILTILNLSICPKWGL